MQKALIKALIALLQPIAKIVMRYGISHSEFSHLAKQVFIAEAEKQCRDEGMSKTTSKVSVLTGISRKEVTRVKKFLLDNSFVQPVSQNRAARVINGWYTDSAFHNKNGAPLDLPLEGSVSFTQLVKIYSGDLTPKVVLDELVRIGAVTTMASAQLRLITKAYIPQNDESEKFRLMGEQCADLLSTMDHNLRNPLASSRFQMACSETLSGEEIASFQQLSETECFNLLNKLDHHLSEAKHSSVENAEQPSDENSRVRLGVGIYYFEQPSNHFKESSLNEI